MSKPTNSTLVSCLFIILNTLFFILGAISLTCSVILYLSKNTNATYPTETIYYGLALGIVLVLISFLGCASPRSYFALYLYTVGLVALIAGQVYVGYMIYNQTVDPKAQISALWSNLDDHQRSVIQQEGKCCGFNGMADRAFQPDQCAKQGYIQGCYPHLEAILKEKEKIVYASLFAFLGVEALVLLVALFLVVRSFGNRKMEQAQHMNQINVY